MLVPVQGGVANLQKRIRTIHREQAMLSTLDVPKVYIFNISNREFRNRIGAGGSYNIPACKPDHKYSDPLVIPMLSVYEFDPAEGGNQMGTRQSFATTQEINGQIEVGSVDDIIGKNSTSPGLGLYTTNLEWCGVFASLHEVPTADELTEAHRKRRERLELIYATGAELVQAGKDVPMIDRPLYNEAAITLGRKPLWGSLDHTRASCPECKEDIIEGANFCKSCQQAIDPASVAARAKKRQREADKLLKEDEAASA